MRPGTPTSIGLTPQPAQPSRVPAARGRSAPPPGPKPVSGLRRWTIRIGATVLMLGAAGVTFGLFGVAGLQVALRLRDVDVPKLAGQTVAEATATLSDVGLAVRASVRPYVRTFFNHFPSTENGAIKGIWSKRKIKTGPKMSKV